MKATTCVLLCAPPLLGLAVLALPRPNVRADQPKPNAVWDVDDVKIGMKGFGQTVMKGTKVERFDAEVLGVLKNTSPGRDMILCRLSGLDLEKTGVIAGMSGSPIYIDGRLLGAVAYAWPFGKEPIAGVTPFSQMQSFVDIHEQNLVDKGKAKRLGLRKPVTIDGLKFDTVTVSSSVADVKPGADDGLWMMPLRTPLASANFSPHALKLLSEKFPGSGMLPMQGGAAPARIADEEKDAKLEPGGPMAVALISGDFDLSGMGTVTHIEGDKVYGWGHPFFGIGACELPLLTGYIHTIYPRQSVSFKMGSPLKQVGVVHADVSTCIAGSLDRKADMMPVSMTVTRNSSSNARNFKVNIVRQKALMAPLTYAALTNSVDMEGELPEEMTAEMTARIKIEGRKPIVVKDTFSGATYSGGRAPQALYNQIAGIVNMLSYNAHEPVRIEGIECVTSIMPGRISADIDAVELDADTYAPGDTVKAWVFLKPYKEGRQRIPLTLKLPADMPEGSYTATICDDVTAARHELRDQPHLNSPQSIDHLFEGLEVQTRAKRTTLALRVPTNSTGVALDGKALPNLPGSMVQILGNTKRTGSQTISGALVAREPTNWVVQGSESARFSVVKNKRNFTDD